MMHLAYRAATGLLAPVLPFYVAHRRRRALHQPLARLRARNRR